MNHFSNINLNTKKILYFLLLSGGVLAISVIAPKLPYELLKTYIKNKKFNKSKFNRDLGRLKKRGDVSISKDSVVITKQGKSRVLRYKLDNLKIKSQKIWDKKWRLVVFDIPQYQKRASDCFRNKLTDLDFMPYQKSIFVCPYPCKDEIDFIKEIFEIGKSVKFILAERIEDEDFFKRKFRL